ASDSGIGADQQLINIYLRKAEFDKALAAIDNLEKKRPNDPAVLHLRGVTLLAMKDEAAARRSFEAALASKPGFFPSASALASLDLAEGKPDLARGRIEGVLKVEPTNLRAMLAMAEISAKAGAPVEKVVALLEAAIKAHPNDATPRRVLIDYYLTTKSNKLALDAAQSAVAALPGIPELVDALGRAQHLAGDTDQALATMKGLAASKPDWPQAQMRLAGMYMLDKKPEQAEQAWRQALKIKPDYLDAQRALIIFYVQGGKSPQALELARKVKEQRPKEPTGWLLEGDIAVAGKKWAEAADAYRNGLKKFPTQNSLAIKLHTALLASAKTADASALAKSWLADHPKDAAFRVHLASVALAQKDYASAEKNYRTALESLPENPMVLNNLAWIAVEKKDPGALALAEKANELAPNQAPFMDTLALALSQKGDHVKALEIQKKAVTLAPENPFLKLNLARIYLNAGDKTNAKIELERLAAMGSKFPMQQEVERLIAAL
ncbi:MAG: XrtA/PEP-CTERM system TPR-repeat protein PrsT, partial [Burkholderiales bacterium]